MLAVSCNPVNLLSFPSPYALICKSWRRERFRIAFLITSNPPSSRMLFVLHLQGIQTVCQTQIRANHVKCIDGNINTNLDPFTLGNNLLMAAKEITLFLEYKNIPFSLTLSSQHTLKFYRNSAVCPYMTKYTMNKLRKVIKHWYYRL